MIMSFRSRSALFLFALVVLSTNFSSGNVNAFATASTRPTTLQSEKRWAKSRQKQSNGSLVSSDLRKPSGVEWITSLRSGSEAAIDNSNKQGESSESFGLRIKTVLGKLGKLVDKNFFLVGLFIAVLSAKFVPSIGVGAGQRSVRLLGVLFCNGTQWRGGEQWLG